VDKITSITKVVVSVHITHTFDGDLTLQLISPDNTTNTLSAHNGLAGHDYGNDCAEGSRTTFDDDATIPISSGLPPFLGSFIPATPLSVFAGKSNRG